MLPSRGFFKKNDCPFFEKGLCVRPHCHFRHKKKVLSENSSSVDSQEDLLLSESLADVPLKNNNDADVPVNCISSSLTQYSSIDTTFQKEESSQDSLFAKLVNQSDPYEKISRHIPCAYTPTPQSKGVQPKNKSFSLKSCANDSKDILQKTQTVFDGYKTINNKKSENEFVSNTLQNNFNQSNSNNNKNIVSLVNSNDNVYTSKCKIPFIEINISDCYEPQSNVKTIYNHFSENENESISSNYVPSKVTAAESQYIPNSNDSSLPLSYVPSKDKPKQSQYVPEPTGNIKNLITYKPSDKTAAGETQYQPESSSYVADYVPTEKSATKTSSSFWLDGGPKNELTEIEFISSEIEMMKELLKEEETSKKAESNKNKLSSKTESIENKSKEEKPHKDKHKSSKSHHSHGTCSKSESFNHLASSKSKSSSSSKHHSSKSSRSDRNRRSSDKHSKKSSSSHKKSKHHSEKSHRNNSRKEKKSDELEKKEKRKKSEDEKSSAEENAVNGFSSDTGESCGKEGNSEAEVELESNKRKIVWEEEKRPFKFLKKEAEELFEDLEEDPDVVEKQCLEIFNSYSSTAEANASKKSTEISLPGEEYENAVQVKKRTAHSTFMTSDHSVLRHKTIKTTKHNIKSAQEVMLERYKSVEKAKESQTLQAPPPPQSAPILGLSRPSVKIAAVSNIQQMLQAKKAIQEKINQGMKVNERTTVAQTVSHGTSRVAHTPLKKEMAERPTVKGGSKQIPQIKRQIYLDKLLLETNQIYPTKDESAEEALRLEEEVFRANSAPNKKRARVISDSEPSNDLDAMDTSSDKENSAEKAADGTLWETLNEGINVGSSSAYHAAFVSMLLRTRRRVMAIRGETSKLNVPRPKMSHSDVLSGGKKNFSVIKTKKVDLSMLTERHIYEELLRCKLTPEELKENGFPMESDRPGYASCSLNFELKYYDKYMYIKKMTGNRRYCIRCSKQYEVDPVTLKQYKEGPDTCYYHPGKKKSGGRNSDRIYNCCNSASSEGCTTHIRHVTDCNDYEKFPNCVKTLSKGSKANPGVFALDCEMVYTRLGYELVRVTVVNLKKEIVYDTLVKPKYPIECFNTYFSGIEEKMLEGVKTTLKDVQAVLLNLFSDKTILIGHSLDSDLRALHLIHDTVVDTAIVYKNEKYHPYKYSLKDLCAKKISKIIQDNVNGHDSAEDAIAALEIMLNHVKEEVSKYDSLESYEADRFK